MKELIEASLDQEKILKQLDFKIRHMKPVWIRENLKKSLISKEALETGQDKEKKIKNVLGKVAHIKVLLSQF